MWHNLVLLDINLSPELADFSPDRDAILITELGLQPRADDMDVIDLANERHAILATADEDIIRKCQIWQERHRECLYVLLLLPQGIEFQRRILGDIRKGRRKLVHSQYERSATWLDVHDDNLLIQAHQEGPPAGARIVQMPLDEFRQLKKLLGLALLLFS
jgi:hypothetical protein